MHAQKNNPQENNLIVLGRLDIIKFANHFYRISIWRKLQRDNRISGALQSAWQHHVVLPGLESGKLVHKIFPGKLFVWERLFVICVNILVYKALAVVVNCKSGCCWHPDSLVLPICLFTSIGNDNGFYSRISCLFHDHFFLEKIPDPISRKHFLKRAALFPSGALS